MVINWIIENSSLLLASIAIIATVRANIIAEKARRYSEKVGNQQLELIIYKQRTELLEEIDKQQALLRRLLFILTRKILKCKNTGTNKELDELNFKVKKIEALLAPYEKQRELLYTIGFDSSPNANERNLADIRRLTLHLEQDIASELDND